VKAALFYQDVASAHAGVDDAQLMARRAARPIDAG
jgi:hypothetical protein